MTYEGKRVMTEDGKDVSEAVATIFDSLVSGMDWGSGFLDNEEMITVIEFAVTMGWEPPIPSSNAEPMVQLALRYPEHYDVYARTDASYGTTRTFYSIVNKGKKPYNAPTLWNKISAEVNDGEANTRS
jgi:hypothetical protein